MPKEDSKAFEQAMEELSKLSPSEMQAKIKELDKMCICGVCPSYMGTGEEKLTFCVIGKSTMIKEENGCICPGCPVQTELALKWEYYCTRGSGKELAGT
jgi:hypothetical protein